MWKSQVIINYFYKKKNFVLPKISTHNFVKELSSSNELQNDKYLCLASHHLKKNSK